MLPGFFNAVFPRQLDMAGVDDTACRMEEGLFNDSLELLDIAGPVAAVEEFHGLVGKRLCRHAVTGRHFRKDMVGNDFHIFHPLPQGRYPDDGANDQFIEALGKEAFIGQTFQVGVTGRNDADIEFPANACLLVENTVFQSISQDIAQLRREFFHFIKEKRSPIGQFQTAGCQMARTIGLAKKFFFQFLFRSFVTAHRNERSRSPWTCLMDTVGKTLLARTRFALEQDVIIPAATRAALCCRAWNSLELPTIL